MSASDPLFRLSAPPPRPVTPGLYLVATPIGNLRDITLRALDVLSAADLVLAEDTRVTAKLMSAYGLKKPLLRYDDHAGDQAVPRVLAALADGQVVAQVSDAGTPLVSDPGYGLVKAVVEAGYALHPIPGPSSVLAALSVADLPTDRFSFAGFAPAKSSARRTFFEGLSHHGGTLVLFESGPRLRASLEDMRHVFGDRPAAVARELTKLYETCVRGPLSALIADPRLDAPKGEIVVLIGPGAEAALDDAQIEAALKEALTRLSPAEAATEIAKATGTPRKLLYKQALALQGRA